MLLLILDIIFVFVCTCFIVVGLVRIRDSITLSVPFVPVRKRALKCIVDMLSLKTGSKLYDLGCGDARVLLEAYASNNAISGTGIEKGILPYLIALVRTRGKPLHIKYGDIFSENISTATHIYCYLSDEMMKALRPKIMSECSPGTRLVSCDFPLPGLSPSEVRNMSSEEDLLAKTLYLYIF